MAANGESAGRFLDDCGHIRDIHQHVVCHNAVEMTVTERQSCGIGDALMPYGAGFFGRLN